MKANVPANVPNVLQSARNVLQRALNVRFVPKQATMHYSTKLDTLGLYFNDAVTRSMRRPNCLMLVRCLVESGNAKKQSCIHFSASLEGHSAR